MKIRQFILILLLLAFQITGCHNRNIGHLRKEIMKFYAIGNEKEPAKIMGDYNNGQLLANLIKDYGSYNDEIFHKKIDENFSDKLWSKQEKELLINGLERTRNDLINEIKGLSEKQWNYKETPSRWSIAEIVEHLFAQNESYRIEMRTVLNQPELPQFAQKAKENDQIFIDYVADTLKADAGILSPFGRFCSIEMSIFAFNKTQDALINMVSTSDKDFRKHFTFRNYVFDGQLSNAEIYNIRDMHQLMLTCIAHMDRHLNQLRKVKSNSDYPY